MPADSNFFRLLVLWCMLMPMTVMAGRVHGRVSDASGRPIPFASVTLKGTTIGTTSNAKGAYTLEVPAGNHVVECRHVGYHRESRSFRMEGQDINLDFVLRIEELTMWRNPAATDSTSPATRVTGVHLQAPNDLTPRLLATRQPTSSTHTSQREAGPTCP